LGVFAFAPFYVWPMALASLAALLALWHLTTSALQAALIGFTWGLGLFLAGASWLYVALHVYGNMPAPLAALCIFLFCCYLALYPALACLTAYKLRSSSRPMRALLLIMPTCFVAAEYLRGWVVTGFPWLITGYSQTPGGWLAAPLAGYAPIFGAFGISWLLALTAPPPPPGHVQRPHVNAVGCDRGGLGGWCGAVEHPLEYTFGRAIKRGPGARQYRSTIKMARRPACRNTR